MSLTQTIFDKTSAPTAAKYVLPDMGTRITSTPQLAYCLSLLRSSLVPVDAISEIENEWLQSVAKDTDEKERLQSIATDLIRAFVRDDVKTSDAVAEIVCLSAVLDPIEFSRLLREFVNNIGQSATLDLPLLNGLAHLLRNATSVNINVDDLVKILDFLYLRLKETHQQSIQHVYRLTTTVSCVLDGMVDCQVKGLKREQLHEPLSEYLKKLQGSPDPILIYQAAYAYQALQHIPDDESLLRSMLRRTEKLARGISGIVAAAETLDLNRFIDGLKNIKGGMDGAFEAMKVTSETIGETKTLIEGGLGLAECLRENFSLSQKSTWYLALRGLDALLQEGRFSEFEKLIREAPCRHDAAFQWGVSQRFGEIAACNIWDTDTQQSAIVFLREFYRDDATWHIHVDVKQWILQILNRLSNSSDEIIARKSCDILQELELESNANMTEETLSQAYLKEHSILCLPFVTQPPQSYPLLDFVQNKPDVEAALRRLKGNRLRDRGNDVYISPKAKTGIGATEDFDLKFKVREFLQSTKKVFLILGDSGAGKSTFNKALEISLWDEYSAGERIPLLINLPSIDKPEHDLIEKQLRRLEFTEQEITELKTYREFILICDGYDESQQTRNIYSSNQMNRSGGWRGQLVIGCRTEYAGIDYKDYFLPTDGSGRGCPELFQEATIAPFNKDQIHDYIDQYVTSSKSSWESEEYKRALKEISNLRDLVANPFLLKLSLDVLPYIAEKEMDFSKIRITRIGLYDEFMKQWLERGKIRLMEMELSFRDKEALKSLFVSGFREQGITYLKEFATAIFDNQGGNPVISYSGFYDRKTWKEEFFDQIDGKNLLLGAMPLICSGTQYRFIHRSILDYGLTLAIFDPNACEDYNKPSLSSFRHGSSDLIQSIECTTSGEKSSIVSLQTILDSPLGRKSYVKESSILEFLVERAQQQPVFMERLHAVIEGSKVDETTRIAATNAITTLVKAGVQFNGADLRGIRIPGADLSNGSFDSAQLEGADLRKVNLRGIWLQNADLSRAQISGVQFGELPFIQGDDSFNFCTYSPNGETLAMASGGKISLYNTLDWSKLRDLEGHRAMVSCLTFSPTGTRLVSGGFDATVRIWDVDTLNLIHVFLGHGSYVTSVTCSPKENLIASGSDDNTVRLWDLDNGQLIRTMQGHDDKVWRVVYSPSGDWVASASSDNTLKLWDAENGDCIHTYMGHDSGVTNIACSPRGDQIASGGWDTTVRLWSTDTRYLTHVLVGHNNTINSIMYSPRGNLVASGSKDKTVRLWNVEVGNCIFILDGHSLPVNCLAFSPVGDRIVSGSDDKSLKLWDVETGNCIHTLKGHDNDVIGVAYSPATDQIVSASYDDTARIWNFGASSCVQESQSHDESVYSIAYSPKKNQVASGSRDSTVRLWDFETGNYIHTLHGHRGFVTIVLYSPSGDLVASGGWDSAVRLWDTETGDCIHIFESNFSQTSSMAYSPKGNQIASGSLRGKVKLWDIHSEKCVRTLDHVSSIDRLIYSPKGDLMASANNDQAVELCDVETGDCIHTLDSKERRRGVGCIAFSPAGDKIASGSGERNVKLWDVETGSCIYTLQGHTEVVTIVVYSPTEKQFASVSRDRTVRLWDVDAGNCIHFLQGHTDEVLCATYSPKGDWIASGSKDRTVRIWDTESGQCLVTITGFKGWIHCIMWETGLDGEYIVTGSEDNSVRCWKVINEGGSGKYKALLRWSSSHLGLNVSGAKFNDMGGMNRVLLSQRGASIMPSLVEE
ncbi:hypothetical protein BGZ46_004838 [Entomortierella lignicola]|nr:hypothetical protein BGZ46_004838 [Entomortierella lignicola]